ncbi:hypothetical protein C0992_006598 [Termitomyces sp. T32_za158]|nr:hypothetical protein C0992_006598 [Termitomyces sp. T32_za158]
MPTTQRPSTRSTSAAGVPSPDSTLSGNHGSHPDTEMEAVRPFGPPLPFLPNAGITGPVPEDFDFEAHIVVPGGVTQLGLPLGTRIRRNVEIERFNEESIASTIDVMATPVPRPPNLDIGPPLKTPYFYTESEIEELVGSQALCESLGPFAPSLIRQIAASRDRGKRDADLARQAEKEKDKEADTSLRNKLLGTMEMQNPIRRVFGEAKEVVIPTVYLLNIRNRLVPPLHFFTNQCIELVHTSPQMIHTKFVRPYGVDEQSGEKVQLLDLSKMISLWGNDDSYECLSPLRFLEASKNMHSALKLLCKAPSEDIDSSQMPTSKSTNYAIEYERHLSYFRQIDDFEDTFPCWYAFEREARMDILLGNVVFDWSKYAARVHIILQTRHALERRDRPYHKIPRHTSSVDVSSARTSTQKFFRESSPACLLCGKAHRLFDHPGNVSTFNDGKPLFVRLSGSQLVVARSGKGSSPKKVCGIWNLNRSCDNRHGNEALHVCSFCGGSHPALSRSPSCARINNGQIQL